MKLSVIFLSVIHLSLAASCFAETDHEKALVGTWEYRQTAGKSFDSKGEILEVSRDKGLLHGIYLGLEREGDHGLFYTVVEMKDLTVRGNGEVSFIVPERDLFTTRPKSIRETKQKKFRSGGFTRDELLMKGSLRGDRLTLHCTSKGYSCPEDVMVFQKGKWSVK